MSRSSIDTKLTDKHYEEFLRRAARGQIEDVHAWLIGLGYSISRTAVGRKLQTLRPVLSPEAIARERAVRTNKTARPIRQAVKGNAAVAHLRAALPYIFDPDLHARVEAHARLIEYVAQSAGKQI